MPHSKTSTFGIAHQLSEPTLAKCTALLRSPQLLHVPHTQDQDTRATPVDVEHDQRMEVGSFLTHKVAAEGQIRGASPTPNASPDRFPQVNPTLGPSGIPLRNHTQSTSPRPATLRVRQKKGISKSGKENCQKPQARSPHEELSSHRLCRLVEHLEVLTIEQHYRGD